jgi:hypothetical protein
MKFVLNLNGEQKDCDLVLFTLTNHVKFAAII